MTIQDAIKSGRSFRRAGWDQWHGPVGYYECLSERVDDILANDWEVKPVEPVVFETQVIEQRHSEICTNFGLQSAWKSCLRPLAGKRVRVTVEELPE